jgi:steroid 5-alpha reductase family enzyme
MWEFGIPVAIASLGAVVALFAVAWGLSATFRNVGVVDLFWAGGFVVVLAVSAAMTSAATNTGAVVLAVAVGLWAARLSLHMAVRFFSDAHEDARYAAFRAEGGPNWWWHSFFKVFLVQAVILWIVATPIHAVFIDPSPTVTPAFLWAGGLLFVAGFMIEAIADLQLASFRGDPKNAGRTCTIGLWSWSRRPNYFGEALVWLGLGLVALGSSHDWWAMVGPVALLVVMLGVSAKLTEAHLAKSKRGYGEYMERVSAIVPRKPKPRATPLPRVADPS